MCERLRSERPYNPREVTTTAIVLDVSVNVSNTNGDVPEMITVYPLPCLLFHLLDMIHDRSDFS